MPTYKGILTNNGKALFANASINSKINFTHIALGDGNGSVPTPSENRSALINEKSRIALNAVGINPNNNNQLVCEAIVPSNIGGFTIRELGLYAGDVLVVHSNYPATVKPTADDGAARELNIKMVVNIQNADVTAVYLDDSLIYATREWVKTNYIPRSDLVNDLSTGGSSKPLSAEQGKVLQNNKVQLDPSPTAQGAYVAWNKTSGQGRTDIISSKGLGVGGFEFWNGKDGNFSSIAVIDSNGNFSKNAASATKLQNARSINITGDATASASFDGTSDAQLNLILANSGVVANTYGTNLKIPALNVNAKGLITSVTEQNLPIVNDLTTGGSSNLLSAEQGKVLQNNKVQLDPSPSNQGSYMAWNKTNGQGRTDIVNHQGQGTGGFEFWNGKDGNFISIATIYSDGTYSKNAASATKLLNTRKINGTDFDGTTDISIKRIDSSGDLALIKSGGGATGLNLFQIYNNGYPAIYGNLLHIGGAGNNQLACSWSGDNRLYHRSKTDLSNDWSNWSTLAFTTDNVSSATKLQNARSINITGDATASASFDGTSNAQLNLSLANSGVTSGNYGTNLKVPRFAVNTKGLITSVTEQNLPVINDLSTGGSSNLLSAEQGKVLQNNKVQLDPSPTAQGAFMAWNKTSGQGRADIISSRGLGVGGFEFWNGKDGNFSSIAVIDSNGNFSKNAASATKLQNTRNINISGDATASAGFDGTSDAQLNLTLANSGVTAGSYGSNLKIPALKVNAKGLITSVTEQSIPVINDLTTGGSSNLLSAEQGKLLQITKTPLLDDKTVPLNQGSYIGWNRNVGLGRMDLINHYGGGSGGFEFWNGKDGKFTSIVTIDSFGNYLGNAISANRLQNARNIALSGDVSGSADFDGTGNINISTVLNNFQNSKAQNGYSFLGNGIIMQWAKISGNTSSNRTITLPITFPNAVTFFSGTYAATRDGNSTKNISLDTRNLATSNISSLPVWIGSADYEDVVYIFAIGY
ncbi:phage tail-collar fiber domain-containing protein [Acinetobacter rathckeae]|uniref:phage tail-collar fiber domain-containing protein n=1 Tax=Acinetobacter rathckeae TaxID=2605272 RepID=UPI0018A2C1BF|nr:phage tail protein [Acinetobacter rathckeae]MBF7687738.1 phage tail protein [Acinetobacter rathckeae]MBF7688039.1 phage tail protein [Acinetobacter rathckeae]